MRSWLMNLIRQHVVIEAMQHGSAERRAERQERAVAQRRKRFAERTERRGQGQVQADRRDAARRR